MSVVTFTRKDNSVVEEEYDSYSVDSTAANTYHDVVLHNDGESDHKDRHRVITANDGPVTGAPRYVHAVFEDGRELGSTDDTSVTEDEQEIPAEAANADGVLTDEEIDKLGHDDLAEALKKRNLAVPKLKSERADALKAAVKPVES